MLQDNNELLKKALEIPELKTMKVEVASEFKERKFPNKANPASQPVPAPSPWRDLPGDFPADSPAQPRLSQETSQQIPQGPPSISPSISPNRCMDLAWTTP